MLSRWFWNAWLNDFRWIWYALISVFILSFTLFWFNYFQGADGVIHWDKIQEQKTLESIVHNFRIGPFELQVPADSYVILEYFNGSKIEMNLLSSEVFAAMLIFSGVILLTVITMLDRFWYFMGMALFILFVFSLRLEVLSLFSQRNQIPSFAILSLFIFLSFYFQVLNKEVSFLKRWIAFMLSTIISMIVGHYFSMVPYPLLYLSVTGYSAGLILSILFILMVSHEIPAAFVHIVGQGDPKSLRHFSVISVIYIFNITIACLHELNVIHWNFIYISPYLLLSISGILGLWGFRLRENLYPNIFTFSPYGAYFFTALATICFVTIAQFLGTSNDPALHIIRNVILFSHVGYGIIFITYVFSNFISMMEKNIPVYKILYKPNRMPYFSFRFAGLIMTLCFVFYSSWHSYIYNGIAGFYNNIGDLYAFLDRSTIAEAYYEQGSNYGFENNHANYALGKLKASSSFNLEGARRNYRSANGRIPTDFSLINEANIFLWQNNFFESIAAYRAGLHNLPNSGELTNNLGFAYGKIHRLDSSVIYLNDARHHKYTKPVAEANFFAIAALEYFPIKCDSVLTFFENPSAVTLSNALALATLQHQDFKTKLDVLQDKKLNLYSATLLNNYIIHNVSALDTVFIREANSIASDSLNANYGEALKSAIAIAYYYQGNVARALQVLGELSYLSQSYQGKYNYMMGLWALEQNNPKLAASYFKYAMDADYKQGKLYYAIALAEGHQREALAAWDTVAAGKDEGEKLMALQMQKTLHTNSNDVHALDDATKYQFFRYRFKLTDTLTFKKLISTFQSDDYKARVLLDMTDHQFELGNLLAAIRYFSQITGLKLTDKNLYDEVQHMELLMLAERRELKSLAKQVNKGIAFPPERKLEKLYYTALLNEAAMDTLNARKNYEILGVYNPYFESGIIAAADYFRRHEPSGMKAYTILVEAVQVNNNSVKILKAYAAEAIRMGFPEYAVSALQQAHEIEKETY